MKVETIRGESAPAASLARQLLVHARSTAGIAVALVLIWIVFSIATGGIFASERNLINLMRQSSITALVAMGMLVVIVQAEIDLSVGSLLGVCTTFIALVETAGVFHPALTVIFAVALGLFVGWLNGFLVAKLGIPSFVATLGGMLAFSGVSLVMSGGRTISGISEEIRFLGEGFITGWALWLVLLAALALTLLPLRKLSTSSKRREILLQVVTGILAVIFLAWISLSYRGLPVPIAIVLLAAIILSWSLDNSVWGRHCYAVGGNREAARVAGIPISRHLFVAYMLIGGLTAIAAVLYVGRLGAAPPSAGYFLELNAIAAVVIGGASLYGGSGTVIGTLFGALLMQSLSNGLSLLNVPSAYQNIASGLVLIAAVYLDAVAKRGGKLFLR